MTTLRERLLAEPPNTPPYVLEDVGAAEPQLVVRALGTDWLATESAWISIGWLAVLGQIMARVLPGRSRRGRTLAGLGFTGLTGFSMLAHQIGTIAAARSVGAPMKGRGLHRDARVQHVSRGGAATGKRPNDPGAWWPGWESPSRRRRVELYRRHPRIRALAYLGWLNVLFTCAALTPLPTMDGGAALRPWRQRQIRA